MSIRPPVPDRDEVAPTTPEGETWERIPEPGRSLLREAGVILPAALSSLTHAPPEMVPELLLAASGELRPGVRKLHLRYVHKGLSAAIPAALLLGSGSGASSEEAPVLGRDADWVWWRERRRRQSLGEPEVPSRRAAWLSVALHRGAARTLPDDGAEFRAAEAYLNTARPEELSYLARLLPALPARRGAGGLLFSGQLALLAVAEVPPDWVAASLIGGVAS